MRTKLQYNMIYFDLINNKNVNGKDGQYCDGWTRKKIQQNKVLAGCFSYDINKLIIIKKFEILIHKKIIINY